MLFMDRIRVYSFTGLALKNKYVVYYSSKYILHL